MADRTDDFYAGDAKIGYGAQLLVGDESSPENFQAIAELRRISPGALTTAIFQKTHLRSPNAHHEKGAGIRDTAPTTIEGNWLPLDESQSNAGGGAGSFVNGGLLAISRSRRERNYIIRFTTEQFGSPVLELPFGGILSNFQISPIELENPMGFTAEITPTGDQTASLP